MANTRKPAGRGSQKKKATAARAEAPPKDTDADDGEEAVTPKELKYRNLTLKLPDALPETVLFDITDIEAGVQLEDPRPIFRLLRSVVGGQQFVAIRNVIAADGLTVGDEVVQLMQDVLGKYGLTSGES